MAATYYTPAESRAYGTESWWQAAAAETARLLRWNSAGTSQQSSVTSTTDYDATRNDVEIGNAGPPVFNVKGLNVGPNITGGNVNVSGNPGAMSPLLIVAAVVVVWLIFRKL